MKDEKQLEYMIGEIMEGKDRVEIRPGLSLNRPSKELDVIQIQDGSMSYYLSLCEPKIMKEVIDFTIDKIRKMKEENPEEDDLQFPDDYPNDIDGEKKKKHKDPVDDNPLIPDFD